MNAPANAHPTARPRAHARLALRLLPLGLPLALLLIVLAACPAAAQPPADEQPEADVVFSGRVVELGAAADPDVPASARTAVVEVLQWLHPDPPGVLAGYEGRRVTVALAGDDLRPGEAAVFYTRLWQLGAGLAVSEIRHQRMSATAAAGDQADREIAAAEERRLRQRLDEAEVVVVGKVVVLRQRVVAESRSGPVTEHDPQWVEAEIEVERQLKGSAEATDDDTIVVRFPGSRDVAWRYAPRLEVGQEGVFLLNEGALVGGATAAVGEPGWEVDEAGEVLPASAADEVARLLNEP